MTDITQIITAIHSSRKATPSSQAILVAISGIDGSGKGYLTKQLVSRLQAQGAKAVGIGIDGWLNLPPVRFNPQHPTETFYHHSIRFTKMFEQLILPLKAERRIHLIADRTEETASAYRPQHYEFADVDIIVLEGIFLLKRDFCQYYDLTIWVDCSFATALQRAIERNQEGLSPDDTIRAYETIYFPAQRLHFERDNSQAAADIIFTNDAGLLVSSSPLALPK